MWKGTHHTTTPLDGLYADTVGLPASETAAQRELVTLEGLYLTSTSQTPCEWCGEAVLQEKTGSQQGTKGAVCEVVMRNNTQKPYSGATLRANRNSFVPIVQPFHRRQQTFSPLNKACRHKHTTPRER
jgi:hypothetical protein